MNYIVLDTEINGRVWKSDKPMETISIGAVKIKEEDVKSSQFTYESFYEYIKPIYAYTDYARKFTGIPKKTIREAKAFPRVIEKFKDWIGEEEYALIGWSDSDKRVLIRDCKIHNLDDSWVDSYIDLQAYIKRWIPESNNQQVSLRNAVDMFGLEWSGEEHDALDDAINTAKIFKHLCKEKTGNFISEFMRGSTCKVYRKCRLCGKFYQPKSNRLQKAKMCNECYTSAAKVK
ncbi:exonuclease domain-containing protein [Aneurinibacillus sp. Ricciae_BoGa-3]|uniref:3'-5' exonuclease n=1 Tax=Aneurinibacillus sp. Ricciae_BoGa-3 TaxID=3022697 RepID=UPI0023427640|nr:3'-5' exonuclease [Aneurinibacillus sp. Ricciae_BoGa-3]WCK53433.1 exonuclease domain-containing protein [Aneurinibacillus sp. Ricciae_BoGa-3]